MRNMVEVPPTDLDLAACAIETRRHRQASTLAEGRRLEAQAELAEIDLAVVAIGPIAHRLIQPCGRHAGPVVGDSNPGVLALERGGYGYPCGRCGAGCFREGRRPRRRAPSGG